MLTRRTILTAAALTAVVAAPAPAQAHPIACELVVEASTATPYPSDLVAGIVDQATATAECIDGAQEPHSAHVVFEWYYNHSIAMPACPTTQSSTQVPGPSRAFVVEGVARCERPPTSDAAGTTRVVGVTLYVAGVVVEETYVWVVGSRP